MSQSKSTIKVIIFDFIGVLLRRRQSYRPNKMADEIDRVIGKVTNDKLFEREIIKKYKLNKREFSAVLNKIIDKYEPFKPLWSLLPELKKKYKLIIINNGTSLTLPKFRKKYPLDSVFDLFISSALEGLKKPDKNIYGLVIRRLGIKPEECLFMDDSLLNIGGAKRFGMITIYWKNQQIGFTKFKKFIDEI